MKRPAKGGSTLSQEARALRGYRNRTLSLTDATYEQMTRLAELLGHGNRSRAVAEAVEARLDQLERERRR